MMGVLNVTPDSFSDGGAVPTHAAALERARSMAAAGADIIDVGGQSTRPGAEQISAEQEAARVVPVIRYAAQAKGRVRVCYTGQAQTLCYTGRIWGD